MEAVMAVLGFSVIVIGLAFAIDRFIKKKTHSQLWVWAEESKNAEREERHWYFSQIFPLKQKVNAILCEWDYYTAETKVQKEEELEELRKAIEGADKVYFEMHNKTEAIRSKIHDYVKEHNLKWAARQWGW